jgi:hypothetical protein
VAIDRKVVLSMWRIECESCCCRLNANHHRVDVENRLVGLLSTEWESCMLSTWTIESSSYRPFNHRWNHQRSSLTQLWWQKSSVNDVGFRRTWDKSEFAQLAAQRADYERKLLGALPPPPPTPLSLPLSQCRLRSFTSLAASDGTSKPDDDDKDRGKDGKGKRHGRRRREIPEEEKPTLPLRERDFRVDLDSTLNKTTIVAREMCVRLGHSVSCAWCTHRPAGGSGRAQGAGYYCEVCDCVLKDSTSFLDHLNGRGRTSCCPDGLAVSSCADGECARRRPEEPRHDHESHTRISRRRPAQAVQHQAAGSGAAAVWFVERHARDCTYESDAPCL